MTLEKEDSKKLEKYFETKKLYVKLGLLVLGIIVVVYLFRKMKVEHNIQS
jgi:hypothetical protein